MELPAFGAYVPPTIWGGALCFLAMANAWYWRFYAGTRLRTFLWQALGMTMTLGVVVLCPFARNIIHAILITCLAATAYYMWLLVGYIGFGLFEEYDDLRRLFAAMGVVERISASVPRTYRKLGERSSIRRSEGVWAGIIAMVAGPFWFVVLPILGWSPNVPSLWLLAGNVLVLGIPGAFLVLFSLVLADR